MEIDLIDGIVIGAFGGTFAGIAVYAVQHIHAYIIYKIEAHRVVTWLKKNTSGEPGQGFRSTRAIASWNNLTLDRARYICSTHKEIYLSTGEQEDIWGVQIPGFPRPSVFKQ